MADRVIVLYEGSVTAEFTRAEAGEHVIMQAATGLVGGVAA
jgi:ABC-type sugar transport system ATPase subunit